MESSLAKTSVAVLLGIILGALGMLVLHHAACVWAEPPPPCVDRLDCQQQRVRDLKDYREYLEGELALCKALLGAERQRPAVPQRETAPSTHLP